MEDFKTKQIKNTTTPQKTTAQENNTTVKLTDDQHWKNIKQLENFKNYKGSKDVSRMQLAINNKII